MATLNSMPGTWKEDVFHHLKEIGLKANMSPIEKMNYDLAWMQYWGIVEQHEDDLKQQRAEGKAEGKAEGIISTARNNARKMKAKGFDDSLISEITGLSIEEIDRL